MDKTNFEKVIDFNHNAGIAVADTPRSNVFTEDPKLVAYRLALIEEEVGELRDAIRDNNFTEVIDALSDILYVVYGAGASFGINLDQTYDIVHRSNMSKFCQTEEEAQQTVEWYKDEYAAKRQPYDSPAYRKSVDDQLWIVYNQSTGKILKSINYTPAKFN